MPNRRCEQERASGSGRVIFRAALMVVFFMAALQPARTQSLQADFSVSTGYRRREIGRGQTLLVEVTVFNKGDSTISSVTLRALSPEEWSVDLDPSRLVNIEPHRNRRTVLRVTPPRGLLPQRQRIVVEAAVGTSIERSTVEVMAGTPRALGGVVAAILGVTIVALFVLVYRRFG